MHNCLRYASQTTPQSYPTASIQSRFDVTPPIRHSHLHKEGSHGAATTFEPSQRAPRPSPKPRRVFARLPQLTARLAPTCQPIWGQSASLIATTHRHDPRAPIARVSSLHGELLHHLCLPRGRPVVSNHHVPAQGVAVARPVVAVRAAQVAVPVRLEVLLQVVLHAKLLGADGAAEAFERLARRSAPSRAGVGTAALVVVLGGLHLLLAEVALRALPLGLQALGAVGDGGNEIHAVAQVGPAAGVGGAAALRARGCLQVGRCLERGTRLASPQDLVAHRGVGGCKHLAERVAGRDGAVQETLLARQQCLVLVGLGARGRSLVAPAGRVRAAARLGHGSHAARHQRPAAGIELARREVRALERTARFFGVRVADLGQAWRVHIYLLLFVYTASILHKSRGRKYIDA
ncbi:unnamed protein product [Ixodes persulcatus]